MGWWLVFVCARRSDWVGRGCEASGLFRLMEALSVVCVWIWKGGYVEEM